MTELQRVQKEIALQFIKHTIKSFDFGNNFSAELIELGKQAIRTGDVDLINQYLRLYDKEYEENVDSEMLLQVSCQVNTELNVLVMLITKYYPDYVNNTDVLIPIDYSQLNDTKFNDYLETDQHDPSFYKFLSI